VGANNYTHLHDSGANVGKAYRCTSALDPANSWQIAVTNMGPSPLAYWDIASTLYVQTSE
jgi:hypothetical protein